MKAIVVSEPGGPEVLRLREVADIEPQRGEIKIRVRATAVNRADLLQRAGKYPAPAGVPADIPGLEYAGDVAATGADVTDVKVGDKVFGLVGGGSYAQFIVTHARATSKMPDNLSYEEAAALPEAAITAYDAMVSQCRLASGEFVLITAAASGVGTAAIQIASAIGARPIGTTRSKSKLERLKEFGLDRVVLDEGNYANAVLDATNGKGVNVVLELVGGQYLEQDLQCVAPKARIIIVGLLAGASCKLNLGQVLSRRLEIRGTTLRARSLEEKILVAQTFSTNLVPLVEAGLLKPMIDKTFALEEAAAAHEFLANNESFGKVVLRVD